MLRQADMHDSSVNDAAVQACCLGQRSALSAKCIIKVSRLRESASWAMPSLRLCLKVACKRNADAAWREAPVRGLIIKADPAAAPVAGPGAHCRGGVPVPFGALQGPYLIEGQRAWRQRAGSCRGGSCIPAGNGSQTICLTA